MQNVEFFFGFGLSTRSNYSVIILFSCLWEHEIQKNPKEEPPQKKAVPNKTLKNMSKFASQKSADLRSSGSGSNPQVSLPNKDPGENRPPTIGWLFFGEKKTTTRNKTAAKPKKQKQKTKPKPVKPTPKPPRSPKTTPRPPKTTPRSPKMLRRWTPKRNSRESSKRCVGQVAWCVYPRKSGGVTGWWLGVLLVVYG